MLFLTDFSFVNFGADFGSVTFGADFGLVFQRGDMFMNRFTSGELAYMILSVAAPAFYIMLYLPIWQGRQLTFTTTVIVLFAFQCFCAALALSRMVMLLCDKSLPFAFEALCFVLFLISTLLTCFVGLIFTLELFNIPWFPQQS